MKHIHNWPRVFPGTNKLFTLLIALSLLNACVTTKKTSYLQEYADSPYSTQYTPPETYKIQPNDNLYVKVNTPDPELAALFNITPQNSMTTNEQATQLMAYSIDLDGTVELPYIGKIVVAGKTLAEAKQLIVEELADYVTDASVTVQLVNNYVTVIGEVNDPGTYLIYKDRLNVFQALALAGDISTYGNRFKISVIRQTQDGSVIKEFDVTDTNIIDSEFYYIMPNDVIVAKPMKGKFFAMNQFPYALVISTITTFILLHSYLTQ